MFVTGVSLELFDDDEMPLSMASARAWLVGRTLQFVVEDTIIFDQPADRFLLSSEVEGEGGPIGIAMPPVPAFPLIVPTKIEDAATFRLLLPYRRSTPIPGPSVLIRGTLDGYINKPYF